VNNCGRAGFEALQARFTFVNGNCAPGNLLRTRANTINGPDEHVAGIDLAARYDFAEVIGGRLTLGMDATYTLEYERDDFLIEGVPVPTAGGRDFVGTRSGLSPLPETRGSAFVEYSRGMHDLRITGRYVDGLTDLNPAARNPDGSLFKIGSYFTTDLVYRLRMPADLTATLAVFNVTDRDPPFVKFLDFSYDPFLYSPVGRALKLGLNKQF
jgi:iron complex outermembrane receptor protein